MTTDSGTRDALCCTCGAARTVRFGGKNNYRPPRCDYENGTCVLKCAHCGDRTRHALVNRETRPGPDGQPSREQQAIEDRDRLVAWLEEFNVAVDFLQCRNEDLRRSDGYFMYYGFDESECCWFIEIDPNAPGSVQARGLRRAWGAIAGGFDGWDVDWDVRKKGVIAAPLYVDWKDAADDLVADIERALPLELQKMRLAEGLRPNDSVLPCR